MFALAIGVSIVTLRLQKDVGAAQGLDYLPWQPRIANVLTGYVWYVTTTLVPVQLAVFHTHRMAIPPVEMILPFVVLAAITIGFVLQFRKHPELLIGWLWFGGTLFPVSGIAQSGPQAYADRFAYVPHIGLFVVLVWGGLALARRLSLGRRTVACCAAAVLVVCTGLSFRQVTLWRDTETLFRHALAIEPDNSWLQMIFGEYYWFHGEPEKAWVELDQALSKDAERPPFVMFDSDGTNRVRSRPISREAEAASAKVDPASRSEGGSRKSQRLSDRDAVDHHNLALALRPRQERYDEARGPRRRRGQRSEARRLADDPRRHPRPPQQRYDDAIASLTAALATSAEVSRSPSSARPRLPQAERIRSGRKTLHRGDRPAARLSDGVERALPRAASRQKALRKRPRRSRPMRVGAHFRRPSSSAAIAHRALPARPPHRGEKRVRRDRTRLSRLGRQERRDRLPHGDVRVPTRAPRRRSNSRSMAAESTDFSGRGNPGSPGRMPGRQRPFRRRGCDHRPGPPVADADAAAEGSASFAARHLPATGESPSEERAAGAIRRMRQAGRAERVVTRGFSGRTAGIACGDPARGIESG